MNFLLYARNFGDFKKTITLGRQNFVNLQVRDLKHLTGVPESLIKCIRKHLNSKEYYVDELLKDCFGSSMVDSIDVSNFEGASIIHDMNIEIPSELKGKYDTVIDGGTIEHVYNIPQALDNASYLCKPGGQILHMLPANNQCGHGFWQMSPELFFSLYTDTNGYTDVDVFLGRPSSPRYFYKVIRPENGKRVNIYSNDEVAIYTRSIKKEAEFSHKKIYQSDYLYLWNKQDHLKNGMYYKLENFLLKNGLIFKMAEKIYLSYYRTINSLSTHNYNLVRYNISNLLMENSDL
jgi:hypothetical protein